VWRAIVLRFGRGGPERLDVIRLIRGHAWTTAIRALAPLGALLLEGWPALVGALIVQEGGLWLAGRLAGTCQRTVARRLFVAAYGLRVAIVLPTHFVRKLSDGVGALYRDDYTSDLVGDWLVRIARGDGVSIFPGHQYLLSSVYSYLLMGVSAIFGHTPLLPKLLNAGLAALCAVIVFDITRKMFNPRAALISGLGAAFLPSLIVWSIATLKETLVLFVALAALWIVQFLATATRRDSRVMDGLVGLLALLLLLLDLRTPVAFIIVALLCVVLLARSHVRLRLWQTSLAALVVIGVLAGGLAVARVRTTDRPLSATFEDIALQIRHRRAQEAAGAVSQIRAETDVISATGGLPASEAASDAQPFSIAGDVLNPLGFALLAPAPWQAQGLMELGASAEMPVWYVLLVASFFAVRGRSRQPLFLACVVLYGVANWLILAAVEGNLGNLLRHRLMLDPALLIMGGAGLDWLWGRRSRPTVVHGRPTTDRVAPVRRQAVATTGPAERSLR
jgi:hypothetical protein